MGRTPAPNFSESTGVGGGGFALERNFFLVGPKDLKTSALTNFFRFVFRSHMEAHDKAKFLCKH